MSRNTSQWDRPSRERYPARTASPQQSDASSRGGQGEPVRVAEYYSRASNFSIYDGDFSTVGGTFYRGPGPHPQRPPAQRQPMHTSYFPDASNFVISGGRFMSVGGDMYDNSPASSWPTPPMSPFNGSGGQPPSAPGYNQFIPSPPLGWGPPTSRPSNAIQPENSYHEDEMYQERRRDPRSNRRSEHGASARRSPGRVRNDYNESHADQDSDSDNESNGEPAVETARRDFNSMDLNRPLPATPPDTPAGLTGGRGTAPVVYITPSSSMGSITQRG